MSHSVRPIAPRRRWPLVLAFGFVAMLAVTWTGLWFYAAGRAKAEATAWREREQQAGRQQDCASQSVGGYPSEVERASLVLDALTVRDPGDTVFKAQRLELHGRQAPGSRPDNPSVEAVLRLNGAVADKLHPLAAKPIDADIATILRGITDVSPKPWAVRFKEWQAQDG